MPGYDDNTCYKNLSDAGMTPICDKLPGSRHHCPDVTNADSAAHKFCYDLAVKFGNESDTYIYAPVRTVVCACKQGRDIVETRIPDGEDCQTYQDKEARPGMRWVPYSCVCCCSCFAYGTPIAVPDGYKLIQEIATGDSVLIATVAKTTAGFALSWNPGTVSFSSGTSGGENPVMVYLAFGTEQSTGDLVCSTDQVFMLASGKLTTADKLQVGDMLVDRNGDPVPVRTLALGSYKGGVHHIGTGTIGGDSILPDNHLVIAGGVVAGDYYLQLYFESLPEEWKAEDHQDRHQLGSSAYADAHGLMRSTAAMVFGEEPQAGTRRMEVQSGVFNIFGQPKDYGEHGVSLFSQAQAYDILENGRQIPLSNTVPKGAVTNLFRIFTGFHPDIKFYLDWYHMEPNVYAFERYGEKFVVVTGGLARTSGFQYEGMAMAIAHGIARFAGVEPQGRDHYTSTAAADFRAFGVISRYLWYTNNWLDTTMEGRSQMEALFKLVSAENAVANPAAPLDEPGVACRMQAIKAAIYSNPLPECAGGPPQPKIALASATATAAGLTLTLTVAPSPSTATDPRNYLLSPAAEITAVRQDPDKDFVIHIDAALAKGKQYTVTIANLRSIVLSGVDPEHNSLVCTVS